MRVLAFNTAHDSSVCSINDGKIEFFCKEERLTGIKRDKNPFKSLELYSSLNFGKIDHILYHTPSNNEISTEFFYKTYISKKFGVEMENYSSLKHHDCHAALAYYNSGFDKALTIVVDRNGSMFFVNGTPMARESESVYVCDKNIKPIYKNFWYFPGQEYNKQKITDSIKEYYKCSTTVKSTLGIVKVYEAATTLIGQDPLENGKTMGLSAYGKNANYFCARDRLFYNNVPVSSKFIHLNNNDKRTCFFNEEKQITKDITKVNYQTYADRAKLVQIETQKEVANLIETYVKKTNINNVCIVGGYGLNVVANQFYLETMPNINFYFEPVADDTGISIGAAMLKSKIKPVPVKDNFYHYYKIKRAPGDKSELLEVCKLLEDKRSVAIFEGSPETGPRALGHRSILFDPRVEDGKDIVNKIKNREWYRPFAGVILKEDLYKHYIKLPIKESPYMTINFNCKTPKLFPAITHVDGTSRMQTVDKGTLFELLKLFKRRNNCPALLNTSFNLAGQPLVYSVEDAIKVFKNSKLDAIYFADQNRLLKKDYLCYKK
jgi:carbamoyltransferase